MKDIFIIGSRGLPAQYGGFETFVDKLVSHSNSTDIGGQTVLQLTLLS